MALICQFTWAMAQSEGQGWGHRGRIDTGRSRHFALTRRQEGDSFAPGYKVCMLVGRYLSERYLLVHHGKAHNLRAALRSQVDAAFGGCHLLVTPTTKAVAPALTLAGASEM